MKQNEINSKSFGGVVVEPIIDLDVTFRQNGFLMLITAVSVFFAAIGVKKRGYLFYGIGWFLFVLYLSTGIDLSSRQVRFDLVFSLIVLVIGAVSLILIDNKDNIRSAVAKRTLNKGWENLSVEEKGRIVASRGPYKERYIPQHDNIYLKLFAEHDETNISDELMKAFDFVSEANWEEASSIFSRESLSSRASPYASFGRELCYLKINTVEDIAKNINRFRIFSNQITDAIQKVTSNNNTSKMMLERTTTQESSISTEDIRPKKEQERPTTKGKKYVCTNCHILFAEWSKECPYCHEIDSIQKRDHERLDNKTQSNSRVPVVVKGGTIWVSKEIAEKIAKGEIDPNRGITADEEQALLNAALSIEYHNSKDQNKE